MSTRKFKIKIEGKVFEAEVEEIGGEATAPSAPKPPAAQKAAPVSQAPIAPASGNAITSPMPGKIIAVKVSKGQKINAGDVVIILEAMKMEQDIKTALGGAVSDILVSAGDTVKKDQALITVG